MVYDNGSLMIGKINDIINYIEYNIHKDIDLVNVDANDLLNDLKDLSKDKRIDIVMVDYDNGFDYLIDYWYENDKVDF